VDWVNFELIQDTTDVVLALGEIWANSHRNLGSSTPDVVLIITRLMDVAAPSDDFKPQVEVVP